MFHILVIRINLRIKPNKNVSKENAKPFPVFWKPRQVKPTVKRAKVEEVKSEPVSGSNNNVKKKKCNQIQCPVKGCNDKVTPGKALSHMTIHQVNNDEEVCICAICGGLGHMPELSSTTKK